MAEGEHTNRRRETLLRLPIGELATWQLLCTCQPCRSERMVALRTLVERCGPEMRLAVLLPRLRCRADGCRQAPARVVLRNKDPARKDGPSFVTIVLRQQAPHPK